MKLFALGLIAIALLPLPAIAKPYSGLNMPACYMVTSKGQLIDLTYMCQGFGKAPTATVSSKLSVTADDVCRAFASDIFTAQNQFQRDRAQEGFSFCRKNRGAIQAEYDKENSVK